MEFFPEEYKEPINKLHLELMQRIGMNECDYFLVASKITPAILFQYLNYAFVMGSEYKKLHLRTDKKPVLRVIVDYRKRYESISEASKENEGATSKGITRAIKRKIRCKGFYWEFAT